MIDIENKIISDITNALEAEFIQNHPGLVVYDTAVEISESFPCVTVVASENTTWKRSLQFGKHSENHAFITFEINVYTNNAVGKKELGKAIFQVIDGVMQFNNFVRIMASPTPNIDRTVARITGRYTALVGEPILQNIDGVDTYVYPVLRN